MAKSYIARVLEAKHSGEVCSFNCTQMLVEAARVQGRENLHRISQEERLRMKIEALRIAVERVMEDEGCAGVKLVLIDGHYVLDLGGGVFERNSYPEGLADMIDCSFCLVADPRNILRVRTWDYSENRRVRTLGFAQIQTEVELTLGEVERLRQAGVRIEVINVELVPGECGEWDLGHVVERLETFAGFNVDL